ncbi:MAG: hypothetical protein ACFE8E_10590 [Candidatus Hodarchaeota archaeon]
MNREKYYRIMFLSGAIWNWLIAIVFILLTLFLLPEAASLVGISIPPSLLFMHGFLVFAFIIGVGLFIISRDINNNRGIAQMCVVEKFSIFTLFLIYFILGDFNIILFLPVVVDLIYGILFLEFLINYKK